MKPLDRTLDRVQREVELDGRSHSECVYLRNLSLTVQSKHVQTTQEEMDHDRLNKLKDVINSLRSENMWMSAELSCGGMHLHFLENDTCIDMIASVPHADVYNSLEQLIVKATKTLKDLCLITNDTAGEITFNLGYAFAKYSDMIYVEENILDYGD